MMVHINMSYKCCITTDLTNWVFFCCWFQTVSNYSLVQYFLVSEPGHHLASFTAYSLRTRHRPIPTSWFASPSAAGNKLGQAKLDWLATLFTQVCAHGGFTVTRPYRIPHAGYSNVNDCN